MNQDYILRLRELAPDAGDEIDNTFCLVRFIQDSENKLPNAQRAEISSLRGKQMMFAGGCVSPGRTADLGLPDDFFLRVVNDSGEELRPHAVFWNAYVIGKFCGVSLPHKMIFLEVDESNYFVLDKG